MNKNVLIFSLLLLISIGFASAVFDYNYTDLSATDPNNWAGTSSVQYPVYDSVHDVVFTSSNTQIIGMYNRSSNVWLNITTSLGSIPIGLAYDSNNNILYYGLSTGVIGKINISNNYNRTTFAGASGLFAIAYNLQNNLLYTGYSSGGQFGAYNRSNNSWINLSSTDAGNWWNVSVMRSMIYANGLIYTGSNDGKLGVYNYTTNVWTDLSATDTVPINNWIGTSIIPSMVYDSVHNLIYLNGNSNYLGVYNPSTNIATRITTVGSSSLATGTYDSTNNLLYFSNGLGSILSFNPSTNVTVDLSYTGTNYTLTPYVAYDNNNGILYTSSTNGKLGYILHSSPCVETWIKSSNNTCDSSLKQKIITYSDSHQCGTTVSLPIDNGTYEYCCVDTWHFNNSVCNGTNYVRKYYDIYGCGTYLNLPSDNGTMLSCSINNNIYVFEQLPYSGVGIVSLAYDSLHNSLYIGGMDGVTPLSVMNISSSVITDLSSTDTANWWNSSRPYGLAYDSLHNLVFTGSGSNDGKFGVYNASSNVWTDLSATDTKLINGVTASNWLGIFSVNAIAVNNVTGMVYVGVSNGNNNFGVYNLSNNTLFGLYQNDVGGWATQIVLSLAVDSSRNLVYTGGNGGQLGVYNASSLVWSDLSSTDAGNWLGTVQIYSLAFDSVHNLVYFSFSNLAGTSQGGIGVYNPVTNISLDLSYTATYPIAPLVRKVVYDSTNDLLYTLDSLGVIGVYNPVTAVWSVVPSMNNWLIYASIGDFTVVNDSIYLGTTGFAVSNGQLGKRIIVSCVENWLPQDSVCNGFTYQIGYYDSNNCGTNLFIPSDNGTVGRCNFNYSLDTWYDLSTTDKIPEYNWLGGTAYAYLLGIFNNSVYFGVGQGVTQTISVYNPFTNIFIPTNTTISVSGSVLFDNGLIYTGYANGYFVRYNISSNILTDLSTTDLNNWAGTSSVNRLVKLDDKIYTFLGSTGAFKFGVYNTSDGVWYNLSSVTDNLSGLSISQMIADTSSKIIYISSATSTGTPTFVYLGAYNTSSNTLMFNTLVGTFTSGGGAIQNMVLSGGLIYTGSSGNSINISLGVYNISNQSWSSLGTSDPNDWVGSSDFGSNNGLAFDSTHNVIYTALSQNKFGVFDINSGVWYNHSILGNTSVGDVLPDVFGTILYDPVHEVLYAGDSGGFHIYKTPYLPPCVELWVSNNSVCSAGFYTVDYYDSNMCGTFTNLPVDNGTMVSCCSPNWTQNLPLTCDGILSNFTISYSDLNNCSSNFSLPINNGTVTSCCVENFVQNNTPCDGYHFIAGYIDLNSCNSTFTLPSDNHLSIACTLEARTSGNTGGNSILVTVPEEALLNGTSTPSNTISEEFFLVSWWDEFVAWIEGWWYS